MFTRHGKHIPGTTLDGLLPENTARCGGVKLCQQCKDDVETHFAVMVGSSEDFLSKAQRIVGEHVDQRLTAYLVGGNDLPPYETYVVWFSKTLQNWKALVGTTLEDRMYYEVTYDGDKHVTYLDEYRKLANLTIPDKR